MLTAIRDVLYELDDRRRQLGDRPGGGSVQLEQGVVVGLGNGREPRRLDSQPVGVLGVEIEPQRRVSCLEYEVGLVGVSLAIEPCVDDVVVRDREVRGDKPGGSARHPWAAADQPGRARAPGRPTR
jgi:hypothetical protein